MSITASHYIDPDGDVDLLLPHLEELPLPLNGVLTYVSPALGLNYRRSSAQYSWTDDEKCKEPEACEVSMAYEATSQEPQQYDEVLLSIEPQLEPIEEARRPDELPEPRQSPEPEEQATPEQPCNTDQDRTMDEHDAAPTPDEKCVRIRTSSKHLTFSSPHFKRNLRSGMLESQTLRSQGHVEFRIAKQDPKAMLIVLNIIHGKSREVPRVVDLDMLTKLAVIVDYLECLEVVEPYSDRWVDNLEGDIPTTYSNELIQWLCISLIFRKQMQFKAVTRTAIRLSRGAIQTLSLPIREGLVDKINLRRYEALDRLLSALDDLLDRFRHDRINCTFECNAIRYGALAKELSFRSLLFPRPHIPFLGYSINDTIASIREIRDPKWCNGNQSSRSYYSSYCQSHSCTLTSHIKPIISSIEDNLKELSLEEFQ